MNTLKEKPKINDNERKVLEVLAEEWTGDMNCFYFRGIVAETKLELAQVKRACRSLAKKGLAEFVRGLFDEDGMVAGSGYCATRAGAALISPCDICGDVSTYRYDGKLECGQHYGESTKNPSNPTKSIL